MKSKEEVMTMMTDSHSSPNPSQLVPSNKQTTIPSPALERLLSRCDDQVEERGRRMGRGI